MCNSTCDSFQEIPIQCFSGKRLRGLLLPLSSGTSGKRKAHWMLGKQAAHTDREQAKILSQEMFLTLSTCLHSHGPLSHAPGSQSFPQVRNQLQQNEVKLNQRCKEKDRSYRTQPLKTHIYCCSEDGSWQKGTWSSPELRERLKATLFTF